MTCPIADDSGSIQNKWDHLIEFGCRHLDVAIRLCRLSRCVLLMSILVGNLPTHCLMGPNCRGDWRVAAVRIDRQAGWVAEWVCIMQRGRRIRWFAIPTGCSSIDFQSPPIGHVQSLWRERRQLIEISQHSVVVRASSDKTICQHSVWRNNTAPRGRMSETWGLILLYDWVGGWLLQ